MQNILSAAVI